MKKTKAQKKEVYFIATKYKNNPTKVVYYTTEGERVPTNLVEKKESTNGTKYFAFI